MVTARWRLLLIPLLAGGCGDGDPLSTQDPSSAVVARVEVTVEAVGLVPGESTLAHATAFSPAGAPLPLVEFVWTSSNPAAVTVAALTPSSDARVEGQAVGVAALTARVGGILSDPVEVAVAEPDPPEGEGP